VESGNWFIHYFKIIYTNIIGGYHPDFYHIMWFVLKNTIMVFTVFRLLTDFVCLYNYEFWLSLCKIVRSSVILLLPLFTYSLYICTKMLYVHLVLLIYKYWNVSLVFCCFLEHWIILLSLIFVIYTFLNRNILNFLISKLLIIYEMMSSSWYTIILCMIACLPNAIYNNLIFIFPDILVPRMNLPTRLLTITYLIVRTFASGTGIESLFYIPIFSAILSICCYWILSKNVNLRRRLRRRKKS
jgi:hypothetical protein